jgi:hypothetical protein
MKILLRKLSIATAILLGVHSTSTFAATYDTFRLDKMPDFTQTDPALSLPNGGRMYCAPVAAANALVWLAESRGFARLLPIRGLSTTEKVATVAKTLGEPDFMSTAPKGGTSPGRFLAGLENYANHVGYLADIGYRGRWEMPSRFGGGGDIADLDWIIEQFDDGNALWLAIGFYEEGDLPGELRRIGGHMVTVAGYGVDENGDAEHGTLVLHDSDDGGATEIQRIYLRTKALREGWFMDPSNKRAAEADGHLVVTHGYRLRNGVIAIIDSAISLGL